MANIKDVAALKAAMNNEATIRGRVAHLIDGIKARLDGLGQNVGSGDIAKLSAALQAERTGLILAVTRGTDEEGQQPPEPTQLPA